MKHILGDVVSVLTLAGEMKRKEMSPYFSVGIFSIYFIISFCVLVNYTKAFFIV